MKGLFTTLAIAATMSLTTFASEKPVKPQELPSNEVSYSPQVCQFSLSKYSGIINSAGNTDSFKVGLSCPQEENVRATVVVFIDNEHVASKVVTIPARNDYSSDVYITVGTEHNGKRYKLVVQ